MKNKTAILIDGAFFLKRFNKTYGYSLDPVYVAKKMYSMSMNHLKKDNDHLHRIFFYDCYPFDKRQHNPISNKCIDFAKTDISKFKLLFFEELKRKRKVALRLSSLHDSKHWKIKPNVLKTLFKKEKDINDLTENDVEYGIQQKGTDIMIGIDIASLVFKKQVDRIILISGDSDFIPAAKLARREGIDFILDPMWVPIKPKLFEHIDGLHSECPKPQKKK